ncbi:hypothetical protein [Kitasatospora sp. NBC_01302]|uniref:hypothetical protein n=1 Tax=Kitasatospora sp. NBC_01302 TaxID=2903575 RepID=UPI002E1589AD|nr:hypothetical protein OG294_14065 [Kitasatospora sp. NBC_01302]
MAKQNTEGHTPLRQLRIPEDEWTALGRLVGDRNRTATIREFIRWYARMPGAKALHRPDRPPGPAEPDGP